MTDKATFMWLFAWLTIASAMVSCNAGDGRKIESPWGVVNDSAGVGDSFDLDRIQANGEIIVLTLGGPDSYYDYRGRHLGLQYILCQRFADHIGVGLRVEVCRDTTDILRRLAADDVMWPPVLFLIMMLRCCLPVHVAFNPVVSESIASVCIGWCRPISRIW